MISNYARLTMNTKFSKWLDENVYISKGIEYMPRKYMIHQFIQELRNLIISKGYVFRLDQKDMAQGWANYVFRMQNDLMKNKKLQANPDDTIEDYDWFCHNFDSQVVEAFSSKWKGMNDYSGNRQAEMLLFTAFDFAWYYVNIKTSSETKKVDEMFDSYETDEDGKFRGRSTRNGKPADPYLDDLANASLKYNRWD